MNPVQRIWVKNEMKCWIFKAGRGGLDDGREGTRQDEPWLRKFRSGLRKKCLTAARFTDDKSFKPFHWDRSAGSKRNLRSNCSQRYGCVVKQSRITGFHRWKTKIFPLVEFVELSIRFDRYR